MVIAKPLVLDKTSPAQMPAAASARPLSRMGQRAYLSYMPVSRGRRGKTRRPGNTRQRPHAQPREWQGLPIPETMTNAELDTVEFIALAMGRLPRQPSCPGPLVVHADGAMECHGADCPGAMVIFHEGDVVDPCQTHPEIHTRHACSRCRDHTDEQVDFPV
jgi:hypothetical protein